MKGGDLSKKVCILEYPLLLGTDSGLPNERRLKRNHHRRHIASSRTRIGEEERAPTPKKSFQGKWSDRVGGERCPRRRIFYQEADNFS